MLYNTQLKRNCETAIEKYNREMKMFQQSIHIHFKCVCFSGSLIHRHMRTNDEDMRLPVSCCGHHRRAKKTGASREAQRYCSNTDPGSDHSARSKHIIHGEKLKKGKTLLLWISMCHSSIFSHVLERCYQSGTPGGRFGQLPRALAGTVVFPLLKGIEIWRCHASCTHWMYFNGHLHVTKKKRNCTWCALQV